MLLNFHNPSLSSKSEIRHNPRDWDSVFNHHIKLKNDGAILKSYSEMESSGVSPRRDQLPVILKACARLRNFEFGRKIHSSIVKSGLVDGAKAMTALIDFYCKIGFLDVALNLFDEMRDRDLVSWNTMMCGFAENLRSMDSLSLFRRMRRDGLLPNAITLVSLLSSCRELCELKLGREIHCYCLKRGFFDSEVHVGTALVDFYSTFDVRASRLVFDLMEVRNKVTWNVILYAYVYSGDFDEMRILFVDMIIESSAPDYVAFLAVLESCADHGFLEFGRQVHQLAIKHGFHYDSFVANALIVMYGKCKDVDSSHEVFQKMPSLDLASWNAMLASYRNCGFFGKALDLFKTMRKRNAKVNSVTIATILSICGQSSNLRTGKELHSYVIKTGFCKDLAVESALLSMYVESNSMSCACRCFNKMKRRLLVSWNTLIKMLFDHGYEYWALELFEKMQQCHEKPNSYTMVSLLSGCGESSINAGKSIHGYIVRHELDVNPALCTALCSMYMSCEFEHAASYLFRTHSKRDVVSWNSMIANYFRIGKPCRALSFIREMHSEAKPDSTTIIITLLCCARMGNLQKGRILHAYTIRREMDLDFDSTYLGNALLTMYAKCGSLKDAAKLFGNRMRKDVISWNAMIAAYGMHGRGEGALKVFYRMLKTGEKPTGVTFVSILASCSHSGLVEVGKGLFCSMIEEYGIRPEIAHYGCIVDLLGRAGFLDSALNLVRSMPMEPDAGVWRALLGACKFSSDIHLARFIGEKLNEIEPMNSGNYILLSNIYAAAGSWEHARALKKQMKEMGLGRNPGTSWMVISDEVNSFSAGNKVLAQVDNISDKLERLLDNLISNWVLY
ncbi:Pentatricopeptide repeat-containing protein [Platanthera zijinensis]|uniref:Pentatricopeptide repeat-containing protein n=1 Tax=Platanthera zijinensis TaxID=2320716 RepID=A0AAP0FY17_9ASPA